jgi:hypothetical protein
MRGSVRAFSFLLAFLPAFLFPPTAFSQERRLVVTEGADYFGADYDVRKDVDLDQCKAACQEDLACRAFTYNQSAGWCFLKSDVGELRAVAGAVSGRIVAASAETRPDVEAERISELGFLSQTYVDEARHFVGRLSDTPASAADAEGAIASAMSARESGDYLSALENYADALRFRPDDFELWMTYTDTAVNASSEDWEVRQTLSINRTAGAVNAYLNAVTPEERARALEYLGWSLGDRYVW